MEWTLRKLNIYVAQWEGWKLTCMSVLRRVVCVGGCTIAGNIRAGRYHNGTAYLNKIEWHRPRHCEQHTGVWWHKQYNEVGVFQLITAYFTV